MANEIVVPRANEDYNTRSTGLHGFIGWQTVEEYLRVSGELKPNERIGGLTITESGIQYQVISE